MKVVFYVSEGKKFDETLAEALGRGVRRRGDEYEVRPIAGFERADPAVDVAIVAGVKGWSQDCFEAYVQAGRHAIILDKGYTRIRGGPLGTLYWRCSVDAFQPHAYLSRAQHSGERWNRLGVTIIPDLGRQKGSVLFCGSSQKYCNWHNLGDATEYARKVLGELRRRTDRELVYRPKPSWGDAVEIPGYRYSAPGDKFLPELDRTFVVVTFGSNAAFEAILRGVPAVVLGDGIARPLARTSCKDVESPLRPAATAVYDLACNVAHCQWSADEMASGEAWKHLRAEIEHSDKTRKR
jgi:hypothetical protein